VASEFVPRSNADDVGVGGRAGNRRCRKVTVLEREQQICARAVNGIRGEGLIARLVLVRGSGKNVPAQLRSEAIIDAKRAVEFPSRCGTLFHLRPAADIVQWLCEIQVSSIDEVLVRATTEAAERLAAIKASTEFEPMR